MADAATKLVGFWSEDEDPRDAVDVTWPRRERVRVATYLRRGHTVAAYLGFSFCRFECGIPWNFMGARDLSDGEWVWPEGFHHYVEHHAVKPRAEFLAAIAPRLPRLLPWWRIGAAWRDAQLGRRIAAARREAEREARLPPRSTPLHAAAEAGDLDGIEAALKGQPIDQRNRLGETALWLAARAGRLDAVRLLLAGGAKVDAADDSDVTPLAEACDAAVAAALLEAGAALDPEPVAHRTPLTGACMASDLERVKLLLDKGAQVNRSDRFRTPLEAAGSRAVIELLLSRGADARAGHPVMSAVHIGDASLLSLLLAHGADARAADGRGQTALLFAAGSRQGDDMIPILLEAGADPNLANDLGDTPLHAACGRTSLPTVERLLAAGANVHTKSQRGMTPLHWAALAPERRDDSAAVLARLLAAGAGPLDARDEWGRTPLAIVTERGDVEAARALAIQSESRLVSSNVLNEAMREAAPLPPGRNGLPLLGETLTFLKDEFRFVREGVRAHGPVFRTRVLGRRTAIIAGPEASAKFNDEADVIRSGGMPSFVEAFFGGKSLPLIDGEPHRQRKRLVLAAFTREALSSYVPAMQGILEKFFAEQRGKEIVATPALKRLTLTVIAKNMFSADPGPDLDTVLESFGRLAKAFSALPIKLPGTTFSKGIAGRDRIFEVGRRAVAEHRKQKQDDGLGRILAATDGEARLSDEEALLELHHFNIAGFATFTHLAMLLYQLAKRDDVRGKLEAEAKEKSPSGPITVEALAKLPYLQAVVKELKRFTPFVPVFFGRARRTFEFAGKTIPEGWMVLWGHHATCFDAKAFRDPDTFDPDRFGPERAEDERTPNAFVPQGVGDLPRGHKCAGYDYATILLSVYTLLLARGIQLTLPEQSLRIRYEIVPPEFADGLRVKFT